MGLPRSANTRVVAGARGPVCPRCRRATEVREHLWITSELRRKPFYFSRWYYCTNPVCSTRLIVHTAFRVENRKP